MPTFEREAEAAGVMIIPVPVARVLRAARGEAPEEVESALRRAHACVGFDVATDGG